MIQVRIWLVSSALEESVEGRVWTLRIPNIFPLLSALWLVGDSVAVSLRCVWTRDKMMSFLRICQVVLLLFILLSTQSCHGCYMCTHGHPHISSHGLLKTSWHLAAHSHVSPILTRLCCGKPSEVVPSFSVHTTP